MKSSINFKVENKLSNKIIISILCVLLIVFFSWCFFTAETVNYKITILYILGMVVVFYFLLKNLLPIIFVNGNNIKYQNIIVPFIYQKTNFKNIKKIKLITRTTHSNADNNIGGGEPYDVMIFYGNKSKLFSIIMSNKNGKQLYETAISHGVHIEDLRKKENK